MGCGLCNLLDKEEILILNKITERPEFGFIKMNFTHNKLRNVNWETVLWISQNSKKIVNGIIE